MLAQQETNVDEWKLQRKAILTQMREGLAAADLHIYLEGRNSTLKDDMEGVFRSVFPNECHSTFCELFQIEQRAMELEHEHQHLEATKLLCTEPSRMTIEFSKIELSTGIMSPETVRRMWVLFRICGVISLKDVLSGALVNTMYEAQKQHFTEHIEEYNQVYSAVMNNDPFGSELPNFALRSKNRYEVKLPLTPPFTNPSVIANRFILTFAKVFWGCLMFLTSLMISGHLT